ncbi:MAG TPA: TA system VapC family ribonuclease toxin [Pseudonocardiaceae bacterium]
MKLLDVNLLIFATNEATARHARARRWFEEIMSGAETVALPWHSLIGFVRVTTRRAVMDPPLTADRALDYVQEWLIQPCVTTVHPTHKHSAVLRDLLNAVGTAGNRVPDTPRRSPPARQGGFCVLDDHGARAAYFQPAPRLLTGRSCGRGRVGGCGRAPGCDGRGRRPHRTSFRSEIS